MAGMFFHELDRTGDYLKTSKSFFYVVSKSERKPLIRLEYDASHQRAVSHWQIHAERGAFTAVLTKAHMAGRTNTPPHDLSKLHLPTGDERFRPALEDFLGFCCANVESTRYPAGSQLSKIVAKSGDDCSSELRYASCP